MGEGNEGWVRWGSFSVTSSSSFLLLVLRSCQSWLGLECMEGPGEVRVAMRSYVRREWGLSYLMFSWRDIFVFPLVDPENLVWSVLRGWEKFGLQWVLMWEKNEVELVDVLLTWIFVFRFVYPKKLQALIESEVYGGAGKGSGCSGFICEKEMSPLDVTSSAFLGCSLCCS